MAMERAIVFDIEGKYAFFKVHGFTRATLTFPFTRTALIGMIAAILGLERNSYWDENNPEAVGNANIAIRFVKSIKHDALTFNYAHTKSVISFNVPLKTYLPVGTERGFVTEMRLDLLRDYHIRVFFMIEGDMYNKLKFALKNHEYYYPPYLGNVNFPANVKYIAEVEMKPVLDRDELSNIETKCAVALDYIDNVILDVLSPFANVINGVPVYHKVVNGKIMDTKRTSFILSQDIHKPLSVSFKENSPIYKIEKVLEDYSGDFNIQNENMVVLMPKMNDIQ